MTIPVACTNKVMYRFDEPVILKAINRRAGQYGGLIALFTPDWSDILTIKVNEQLVDESKWHELPMIVLNTSLEVLKNINELCGGTVYICQAIYHDVDSSPLAFRVATAILWGVFKPIG